MKYFCEVEIHSRKTPAHQKALYIVGSIGIVVALLASYYHWETL